MTHQTLYLRIWRTAFERDKLELHYATRPEAVRMRLNLYRAVRKYRKDDTPDPGFSAMLEKLETAIEVLPNDFILIIRNKELNPLLLEAGKQLDELGEL